MRNKLLKTAVILLTCASLTLVSTVVIYEKHASKNIAVNMSKRIVAELGAALAKNIFRNKKINNFPFGPGEKNTDLPAKEAILAAAVKYMDDSTIKIIDIVNRRISPYATNFQYEDLTNTSLRLLREKYRLYELVDSAPSELDRMIILRNWVRNRIPSGTPRGVDYNFNALDILSRAENGEKFFCSEYSTVFVQCALSIGLIARYGGLFKGHVVAEIWSNDFEKWVAMDVTNDLYYERSGIPLNILELHDIWETGDFDGIRASSGLQRQDLSTGEKADLLSYYHEFYIRMRNDWFSHRYPHWHPSANSIMNGLEWKDRYTSDNILVARQTSDKEEMYFPLNITSLFTAPQENSRGRMDIVFDSFTPGFSHFVITLDDKSTLEQADNRFTWRLHEGENKLEVCSVNVLGVSGSPSRIIVSAEGIVS